MKNIFLLFAFVCCSFASATAQQKLAHMNSGNILEKLPEVKQANKQLEAYQKQLMAKGQTMSKQFQDKYQKYMQEGQSLTEAERNTREAGLQKEQEKISKYSQEVQTNLEKKRQVLLKPILERVDAIIKGVAKENGYSFVFDTSAGASLYSAQSDDISGLVKAKLGLK